MFIYHILFTHSSFEEHLVCFYFLAIVNNDHGHKISEVPAFTSLVYNQKCNCWIIWLCFFFLRNQHILCHGDCFILYSQSNVSGRTPNCSHLYQRLSFSVCFFDYHEMSVKEYFTISLIYTSLRISDTEHLFMCLSSHLFIFFGEISIKFFVHFWDRLWVLLLLSCLLYIPDILFLADT